MYTTSTLVKVIDISVSFSFTGLFISAPIKLYGTRIVAMLGCVIMAAGVASSFLADSVIMLCLTYGLISGK